MKEAGSAFLVSSKYILPNTFDGRFQGRKYVSGEIRGKQIPATRKSKKIEDACAHPV
jgi:hypothetical protein